MTTTLIVCLILLVCAVILLLVLYVKWHSTVIEIRQLQVENERMKRALSIIEGQGGDTAQNEDLLLRSLDKLVAERKTIEEEKNKIEERNRKIWKMSEVALREKHRLEEMTTALKTENEHLELEKEKLADKIKKLWQTSISVHKEKEKISTLHELLAIEKKKHLEFIKAQGDVLKDIAYIQSHEVRGPLSTIMGLVQLFNYDDPADPGNIELLEGIALVAHRLDKVVTEVVNKENSLNKDINMTEDVA